jgi:hypothetical protein
MIRSVRTAAVVIVLAAVAVLGAGAVPAHARAATTFLHIRNGTYSSICLGLQRSSGPNVVIGSCNLYSLSQQWYTKAGPEYLWYGGELFAYFQYANRQTNTCLGVHAGSATSGERLVIGPCKALSDHSQVWAWIDWGNGRTVLINGHSGLCIGTQGSGTVGGTLAVQGHCYGTPTQDWVLD